MYTFQITTSRSKVYENQTNETKLNLFFFFAKMWNLRIKFHQNLLPKFHENLDWTLVEFLCFLIVAFLLMGFSYTASVFFGLQLF